LDFHAKQPPGKADFSIDYNYPVYQIFPGHRFLNLGKGGTAISGIGSVKKSEKLRLCCRDLARSHL
jgi:hypothetical protein